jgi:hypothetical protein
MTQARESVVLAGTIVDEMMLAARNGGEAEMKQSWA